MATAVYTYTIHDLLTNAMICEIPLTNVKYGKKLCNSGAMTGTFTVDVASNPSRMVQDPYDVTTPCRRCLYVWRDEVPQWGGIIWTRKYDSRTRQVQIGCGDWWSYFDHRKLLPVLTLPVNPQFDVANKLVSYTATDQNTIARNLVALAQTHTGGNLNIVPSDTQLSLINRDRNYRGYENQDIGTALRQLAGVINGPDMMFDVGPLDASGRPTRVFREGVPRLGQQGSAWVWEYGGNVVDYTWPSDGSRFASRTFAAGTGMVEGTPIAVSEDTTIYARGYPLTEAEASYSTVSDVTDLQQHADADQEAARLPIVLPVLEVRGDMAPMVGEWGMGDDARVIIVDDFWPNGVDTSMRIVAADVTPPEGGTDEIVKLTMAPVFDDVA
jgi:hypothetical protein